MKVKVLYLNSEDLCVEIQDEHDLFEGGWKDYYYEMEFGCLDRRVPSYRNIDRSIYVVSDGGEFFRLKTGGWYNICWRCSTCHIWKEEDPEVIAMLNKALQ